jgi:hypothetical protein
MFDEQVRLAAFQWLEEKSLYYDEVIPREVLEKGFALNERHISIV